MIENKRRNIGGGGNEMGKDIKEEPSWRKNFQSIPEIGDLEKTFSSGDSPLLTKEVKPCRIGKIKKKY